jgi:hypothetical protein
MRKEMNITFTQDQLAIIDKALQQLPYHLAAPLFAHINSEIGKSSQSPHAETAKARVMTNQDVICPKTHQQNGE